MTRRADPTWPDDARLDDVSRKVWLLLHREQLPAERWIPLLFQLVYTLTEQALGTRGARDLLREVADAGMEKLTAERDDKASEWLQ